MAKVEKRTARTDIYRYGKKTPSGNKQGYTLDRSQPRDEKDEVLIKKGQQYYTWQLYKSPRQISLTPPRRQQLTNSDFLRSVYDIEDRISNLESISDPEEFKDEVENIISELEGLRDEQDEKKSNMPEGLQEGSTGELLQDRYDNLDEMINEMEGIDLDFDEEEDDIDDWIISKAEEFNNISYSGN